MQLIFFKKDSEGSKQVGYRNTANVTSFSDLLEREREFMTVESLLAMNQNWGLAFYLGANDIKVINQISSSIDSICNHYDVSQGYIPYRKSDLIKIYGKEEGERIVKSDCGILCSLWIIHIFKRFMVVILLSIVIIQLANMSNMESI